MIGIVASRLVERFGRPVVLIAGAPRAATGRAPGAPAARSTFTARSRRAPGTSSATAAIARPPGLSIRPERVEAFAAAFAAHADAVLERRGSAPARRRSTRSCAAPSSGSRSCQELARLAPFGLGNPGVTLLVDDCELDRLDTVGEGKHLRFRVRQRGRDAGSAIAFGFGGQIDRYRRIGRYDVAFRLAENRWNGTVAPQLVVRRIFDTDERYEELHAWFARAVAARRGGLDARGAGGVRRARARAAEATRRSLLESERFRQLLLEEPPLAAAA